MGVLTNKYCPGAPHIYVTKAWSFFYFLLDYIGNVYLPNDSEEVNSKTSSRRKFQCNLHCTDYGICHLRIRCRQSQEISSAGEVLLWLAEMQKIEDTCSVDEYL